MKVARVVNLRQRKKFFPVERKRILDESSDLQLPAAQIDIGLLAQIEDWPIPYFVLANRKSRHPVPVRRSGAFRRQAFELHVHPVLVERDLSLNVLLAAFDEISFVRHRFIS